MDNKDDFYEDLLTKTDSCVSQTECTGLMPTVPENDYEAESYNNIVVVPKQRKRKKGKSS